MSISCDCDYDGEYPDFYTETKPVARKEHKCCECHGSIRKGDQYKKITGKWDGRIETYRTCPDCQVIRCDFGKAAENCNCVVLGEMPSTLRRSYRNSDRIEADRLLLPIICAFNAASKERGGIQISIPA